MKPHKTLSLRREALAELRADELDGLAGAAEAAIRTPTCPTVGFSHCGTSCVTLPLVQCLVSGAACS